MNRRRLFPWILSGLFVMLSVVAGCSGLGPGLEPTVTPTPTLTPLPTCIPNPNDFFSRNEGSNKDATKIADDVYVEFLNARTNNDENWKNRVRSQALQFLSYETRRWTRIHDETISDGSKIRIIITFISPELVRAVTLNHAIHQVYIENDNLNEYTKRILQNMDQRNDYMFLITLQPQAANNSTARIYLPAGNFVLKGTSGIQIPKVRNDSFLNEPLSMSSDVRAGFVYFTFGQLYVALCKPALDYQRDTSLTLVIREMEIGEIKRDIVIEIPFTSPMLTGGGVIPTPDPTTVISPDMFSPSEKLPPMSDDESLYWNNLGRFIWSKLTLDNLSTP